jgi:hypothetical protein
VTGEGVPIPKIDTSVPHSARIWNYWLGGKDNYPVDREAGDKYREIYPQIVDVARAGRYFLARSVRFLAADAGVRQFIDVGTGLPAADNTHQVAQRVTPECRVVYVVPAPASGRGTAESHYGAQDVRGRPLPGSSVHAFDGSAAVAVLKCCTYALTPRDVR